MVQTVDKKENTRPCLRCVCFTVKQLIICSDYMV